MIKAGFLFEYLSFLRLVKTIHLKKTASRKRTRIREGYALKQKMFVQNMKCFTVSIL